MVDWMVEVTYSFKCAERTYFLAVEIFDQFLHKKGESKCLKNSDVHLLGIMSMYLASKYEDVIPINSYIAQSKISHNSIS